MDPSKLSRRLKQLDRILDSDVTDDSNLRRCPVIPFQKEIPQSKHARNENRCTMSQVLWCRSCKQNALEESITKTSFTMEVYRYSCATCGFEEAGQSTFCPTCNSLLTTREDIKSAGGSGDWFTNTLFCVCGYERIVCRFWSSELCC